MIAFLLALGYWQYGWAYEALKQRANVPAKQQAERGADAKADTTQVEQGSKSITVPSPKNVASIQQPPSDNQTDKANEASEYTSILGHHIKITDALLCLFTFLLWWSTRRLVHGAEDASQRQLRAYLSAIPTTVVVNKNPNHIRVAIKIHNSGQTPAYKMVCRGAAEIFKYPLPDNFPFPRFQTTEYSQSVVDPNSEHDGYAENYVPFTAEQIKTLTTNPNMRVFIFAEINYIDAFQKPKKTRICQAAIQNPFAGKVGAEIQFQYDRQHNESD